MTRYAGEPGLSSRGNGLQRLGDFMFVRPSQLLEDLAVAQENQGRPHLDAKRAAQRAARTVLNLDVAEFGVLLEQTRQLGHSAWQCGHQLRRIPEAPHRSSDRFRLGSVRYRVLSPRSTFEIMSSESCLISQIAKSPLNSQHPENTLSATF